MKSPSQLGSLVKVSLPLEGDQRPQISFDLSEHEFYAIGVVMVQWAYLEQMVLVSTLNLYENQELNIPEDATQDSFRKRMKAFRKAVNILAAPENKDALINIIDRIANANSKRQVFAHGVWSYDFKNIDRLEAHKISSDGVRNQGFEVEEMRDFAAEIGRLSFALQYPGGKDDFFKEKAEEGGSISREFLRLMSKTSKED